MIAWIIDLKAEDKTMSSDMLDRIAALEADVAQLKQQLPNRGIQERSWLDSDLSRLGEFEPYDWQLGEIEAGKPVKYIPSVGMVVDE
jgi:hypothetical protein